MEARPGTCGDSLDDLFDELKSKIPAVVDQSVESSRKKALDFATVTVKEAQTSARNMLQPRFGNCLLKESSDRARGFESYWRINAFM